MAALQDCPKCHRSGLEPIYHKADDPKCLEGKYINTATWEHLHFKCRCGYDFFKSVDEGEDI